MTALKAHLTEAELEVGRKNAEIVRLEAHENDSTEEVVKLANELNRVRSELGMSILYQADYQ